MKATILTSLLIIASPLLAGKQDDLIGAYSNQAEGFHLQSLILASDGKGYFFASPWGVPVKWTYDAKSSTITIEGNLAENRPLEKRILRFREEDKTVITSEEAVPPDKRELKSIQKAIPEQLQTALDQFDWDFSKQEAERTITLQILTPDGQPIKDAQFLYKTAFSGTSGSGASDDSGRIVLRAKLGDTIDGEVVPGEEFGAVKLYISSMRWGVPLHWTTPSSLLPRHPPQWILQRHWSTAFGSKAFQSYGFFLTSFDDASQLSVDVYLPWRDRPERLPYQELAGLAERLKEAQRTGRLFRPEMTVQNVESYLQLSEIARVYDPKAPVGNYAREIFRYLELKHDSTQRVLDKLTAESAEPEVRAAGLSQLLELFRIPFVPTQSWQEKRGLMQRRLDQDRAILKSILKAE